MCKLAYIRIKDETAYSRCIDMICYQENISAGHSTGFTYRATDGSFRTRKAIGKINSFLAKFPDKPSSKECLGHSRYATVGEINLENQHPISIMFKDKKIGYGIHNGTFTDYKQFEQYRSSGMTNKTDSALLFTLFSRALEQLGDSKENRRLAFSFIMSLIKHESNHNIIIMFKNGQVLFSGNVLSFSVSEQEDKIGIMTFGLTNPTEDKFVYEIIGYKVNKYLHRFSSNISITRRGVV